MSANARAADRFAPPAASIWQRIVAGPRQGWLSVLLLGVVLATVGMAIEDSKWVGFTDDGARSQTDFLPLAFVLAGGVGLLLGRSRLSTALSHLIAAVTGAAYILIAASGSVSDAPTLAARLRVLSESFGVFVNDVFVLGARSTETSAFLIVIGAISWVTGYFAAYNVFRRNRGVPAVVACGLVLLVNMTITARFQYVHLVVLALASMLLLVRLNVLHQEVGWRRRHIGNGEDVSGLFLRGGATFVTLALVGALILAATASSAPLSGFWRNMDDQLVNLTVAFNRVVGGVTGSTKQAGGLFGSTETIIGVWEASDQPMFTAVTSDGSAPYWRGATYDDFDGLTWTQLDRQAIDVAAGASLVGSTKDALGATPPARAQLAARITSINLIGGTMLAPETPVSTDRDTQVRTAGLNGPLTTVDFRDSVQPGQSYTVSALVPQTAATKGPLTASFLAAAGTIYPDWIGRYLAVRPNAVGKVSIDAAERIRNALPANERDPYHVALAVQTFFDSRGGFTYSTDVRGICGRESIVDCLIQHKVGYCQHYATGMTMLLRTLGIPARFVEGYLPGREVGDSAGTRQVDASAAHAWVEVYFPNYGWVKFDPTPGNTVNGREPTVLPIGDPVPTGPGGAGPSPTPGDGDIPPFRIPEEGQDPGSAPLQAPSPPDPGAIGLLVVTTLLLLAGILTFVARRRRSPVFAGDQTFDRVGRLAGRFGYAPRPSQTAYEYAGTLGDVLPSIRQELQVVAHAKVESTYARRVPNASAVEALRNAYARIRRGMLRLVFRRGGGGRRPGGRLR
jgi:transglutaminase-like putative cysteine protease